MTHYDLKISGKVQGVFFRQSAKEKADELNIKGFARNEPDGTVYIEAEGDENSIQNFIDWCKRGSDAAHVDNIHKSESPLKGYSDFKIS